MSENKTELDTRGEIKSNPTCSICNQQDSVDNMIRCYSCKKVAHKVCCKATADQWTCGQCAGNLEVQSTKSTSSKSRTSKTSSSRRKELHLKRLEEEKVLKLKELAIEREFLKQKYTLLEEVESENESEAESKHSVKSRAIFVDDWVNSINHDGLEEISKTLPQKSTLNPSAPVFGTQIHRGPNMCSCANPNQVTSTKAQTTAEANHHYSNVDPQPTKICESRTDPEKQVEPSQSFFPENINRQNEFYMQNTQLPQITSEEPVDLQKQSKAATDYCLTNSQINARKISFELPKFSGKPKEWPHFISSFEESTKLCGFQDFENISRLRHSLKGIAFDAVWSQLTMNGDVNTIISTLKTLFGRPEIIVKELIQEVQSSKPIKDDNLLSIMTFAMSVQNLVATITSCKLTTYLNNTFVLESLIEKLPSSLKLQWGRRSLSIKDPNIAHFNSWLQELSLSARSVTNEVPKQSTTEVKQEKKATTKNFVYVHTDSKEGTLSSDCVVCGSICASLEQCEIFKDFSLKEKWDVVNSNYLCRTCLKSRHKKQCPQSKECMVNGCSFKHNPLLHKHSSSAVNIHSENIVATQLDGEKQQSVIYKVVPVKVYGPHSFIETFAFLDDGSSLTLIDQEITDELGIAGVKKPLCLTWTGNASRVEKDSQIVSISISSLDGTSVYHMPEVRTVEDLALFKQSLKSDYIRKFQHLQNLPIILYESAKPRLLIGLKHSNLGTPIKTYEGKPNEPICFLTRLGYVVFGPGEFSGETRKNSVNVHNCDCELHSLVNSYFSLESVGIVATERSLIPSDEKRAIEILQNTTKRVGNRFECGLLWRFDKTTLPDNLTMARKRLQCLKRKLDCDKSLRLVMHQQISEYLVKGYIRQLSQTEASIRTNRTWYLPIFPVINPNKPNKVRIVWDAAAKCNDVSLNSVLLKGPDQMSSLVGVLQRFRQHEYAVCGDIMQMFHQIKIREADQDSQRFLWMDEEGKEIIYVMQVMTFGACCSPCSAQFIKNLNAKRYAASHPRAVIGITRNHYVDDFLDSASSEEELIQLAKDVRTIHKNGGFLIRNWISNSTTVLESLGENFSSEEKSLNISEENEIEKVLGLWWSTKDDVFTYNLRTNAQNNDLLTGLIIPTKRQLLSTMMKIFDPLGFLANAMIHVKIILQEVWKSGVEWDERILPEQFSKWKEWLKAISKVGELTIPRWYFKTSSPINLELHVFVDGSLQAYSAVAYFCSGPKSNRHCSLITAKSKVASMKLTSVPRIELMGALIGARLAKSIADEHSLIIDRRFFWCDSLTVLKWIYNDRLKFKQFVGFRIGEILELSSANEWRYVPSKLNVADQGTKDSKSPIISNDSEWFRGPGFLLNSEDYWPSNIVNDSEDITTEMREVYVHSEHFIPNLIAVEKFSSWKRLYRVTAWIVKAAEKWKVYRRSTEKSAPLLTMEEMKRAENILLRQCQYDAFPDEMIILEKVKEGICNLKLEKSSSLYKETPYLDDNGVARRRGRIDAANVPFEIKRPVLLPRKHTLTNLIIQYYHEYYKHANDNSVINELHQKYAIPSVRVQLKVVKANCQKCKNDKAVPEPPLMSELPSARLQNFVRPFSYVGADYFGPITITVRRQPEKRWIMLLTCLTVRAIHLEIAGSLTTDSCIMCVTRFIARRGMPIEILSDNGTNFKGAANELKMFLGDEDNQNALVEKFTTPTMKWKFITPGAPHMGGSWERLVRSVKTTLSQMSFTRNPSEELLHTMLLEVEGIINSRPITHVGVDEMSQEALTPNHFLLGSSCGSKPIGSDPEFYEEHTVLRKQWMTAQQLANQFWIRWTRECLPKLSRRTKWYEQNKQVEVGDVVILFDERTARNSYPKGVVVETIRSKADNHVRSAIVETENGRYTRPVVKMAVLDVLRKAPEDQQALPGGSVSDREN